MADFYIPSSFRNASDCIVAAYATGLRDGDRARHRFIPDIDDTADRIEAFATYAPMVAIIAAYNRGRKAGLNS